MTDLFGGSPNLTTLSDCEEVQFLDTTLRDGEQAPGVSLSPQEKAEISTALDAGGISVIEAGSACTSEAERDAIRRVTSLGLEARITSFARGIREDIDYALDCEVDGINLVVPASDRHIEQKVDSTRNEVIETTIDLVEYATAHGLWVEVLGEDGSRADDDFLERLFGAALDAGADRICYCDTVGHSNPAQTAETVNRLSTLGPTSTHTHDDLGLALTNALASIAAGANMVHATVNGIGERAGNVALEEVAIALDHAYDIETVEMTELYGLAQTVAQATDISLPPNKAVVGSNAFAHESGIHTDGTLKDEAMYEPYPPQKVGRNRRLVLGKHSGRASVRAVLEDHDVAVDDDELSSVVSRVQERAECTTPITDTDVLAIAADLRTG